ncbi:HAMP domain-containing histidine kinase [Pectobacterium brasiliense]|uniref:sensor histidine kinase n=1 Tax=Pectobacterium brasiliense TaxID=180957 RepID=UPI001D0D5655|nr:HAMP domain-containing sensor histidine kinase [Pectobacterium brasiliense]UDQ75266.1 HAMP domain-containing histidine kinase [Pectobacterium brasiliense]
MSWKDVSERVSYLRLNNNLDDAIYLCNQYLEKDEANKYLRNILFDIYFQKENYNDSVKTLIGNLNFISQSDADVKNFAKRLYRLKNKLSSFNFYTLKSDILNFLDTGKIKKEVSFKIKSLIEQSSDHEEIIKPYLEDFSRLSKNDINFNYFVKWEKELEKSAPGIIIILIDEHILNRVRGEICWRIDFYCVSIYEKFKHQSKALKIVHELLLIKLEPVAIRALLRICRQKEDYSAADKLFERYPHILRVRDFNIMYELVYYFEFLDDMHSVQTVLRTITKGFSGNVPALRTARNFYIRFGMIDEVKALDEITTGLERNKKHIKFADEARESETELVSKFQELYSQLEHQKQLAAISDLTTGISHELGQPLTNIRYTIQFYKMLLEKKLEIETVNKVFSSILEETERMGGLIRRLSPLTSSRGVNEPFDIIEKIKKRIEGESPKLTENFISANIKDHKPIYLNGDHVKFEQLISNLLLNSIDAINEKVSDKVRKINIVAHEQDDKVIIDFMDSGIGISPENRNKIFDPFFSTKAPGKGEGLGLFIVWNLLKMLGGKIVVDSKYKSGAKFIVTIPKFKQIQSDNI